MGTKRKRGIAVVSLVCLMLFVTACGSGRAEEPVANADVGKVREEAEAEMKARHQERTQESRNAADSDEDDEAERNAEETADKEEESREPEEAGTNTLTGRLASITNPMFFLL